MRSHYEQLVYTAREESELHRHRISEVELQVSKSTAQRHEVFNQITVEKKEKSLLHAHLLQSQQRVESLGRQVAQLVSKETEMMEESRKLKRDLDKATWQAQSRIPKLPAKFVAAPEPATLTHADGVSPGYTNVADLWVCRLAN